MTLTQTEAKVLNNLGLVLSILGAVGSIMVIFVSIDQQQLK